MKYGVIRGRHRLAAMKQVGEKRVRVLVHYPGGGSEMSTAPIESLIPDPDVQHDWTFRELNVERMVANWNPGIAGVLDVCQLSGDRMLSLAEKAKIKNMMDGHQRKVSTLETVLDSAAAGEIHCVNILAIGERCGFEIGKCRSGKPYYRIEAVGTLLQIEHRSPDELEAMLKLNYDHWFDRKHTNQNLWLGGLGWFVAEGYHKRITANGSAKLKQCIPGEVILAARDEAVNYGGGTGMKHPATRLIAERLRKIARVRVQQDT